MSTHTATDCRIYVACLASYNSGTLHGAWCDFTEDMDEQVQAMLKASKEEGAEEWAIHDSEGFPPGYVKEYSGFDQLADMAELIEEHGLELVTAAMDCTSDTDVDAIRTMIEDNYCGAHDSLADWAEELCTDTDDGALKDLPRFIKYHIDWEAVATRELILGGDYQEVRIGGTHHVFRNE